MKLTVLVPTYRRLDDLLRCLNALKQQVRLADEILVTVRSSDLETWEFLQEFNRDSLPLRALNLDSPGQVFALNAGLAAATGDIIAITDDDAAPHVNWLKLIEAHFEADPGLGAVGGKDILYRNGEKLDFEAVTTVGKLQWFGRTIGNHHCGTGEAREVDILKGVNMSYRSSAIKYLRFDTRLRGNGAQVCNDMSFSLSVRRAGWKVIYDPEVLVDHFPAPRFDEDRRDEFSQIAFLNHVYNETLTVLDSLNIFQKAAFLIWGLLVGTCMSLGLVQLIRFIPSEGKLAFDKWIASLSGQLSAYKCWIMGCQY